LITSFDHRLTPLVILRNSCSTFVNTLDKIVNIDIWTANKHELILGIILIPGLRAIKRDLSVYYLERAFLIGVLT
jgi:hypothetical protein